jgi:hypothetical protein
MTQVKAGCKAKTKAKHFYTQGSNMIVPYDFQNISIVQAAGELQNNEFPFN